MAYPSHVPPPAPPARRVRKRRWPIVLAAVFAPVLLIVSVVQLVGGFDEGTYRPVRPGTWVRTGEFQARVRSATWEKSTFTEGRLAGSHYMRIVADVRHLGDQPAQPWGSSLLGFRMDGKQHSARTLDQIEDARTGKSYRATYVMPRMEVRLQVSGLVLSTVRRSAPQRIDVLLLGSERTLGEVPDDPTSEWRWQPTDEVVATVSLPVRT